MSLGERVMWTEDVEPPTIEAVSLEDLMDKLAITDAPESVQIRVLTAYASTVPQDIAQEAASRGLMPPPTLP